MWLEVEVGPRLFVPPEDDSYSVNFVMEVINRAYPGCTGMYLDRAGNMLAFMVKKVARGPASFKMSRSRPAELWGELPTWMGYTARWRVRCISLTEANEILTGCKRLEKENRRQERLQFQERLASMHQFSNLSANAIPFQLQAALPTPRPAGVAGGLLEQGRDGASSDFSPPHRTSGSPLNRLSSPACYPPLQSSDDGGLTTDGSATDLTSYKKRRRSRGNKSSRSSKSDGSASDSNRSTSSNGGRKKKDGFSSKIHIPKFGGKKGHSGDVTEAFWQWARCITYYRDYYEDSYLMALVVSSLMGDTSDLFDWILSLNPGNTQDLTTLLQMLREHYCGSLTFREQRNTIENLHQRPQEAAIDFLIRVSTSVSNLGKDWKDKLMEKELQSLQYEVFLNGVQEEIRHVLDSEVAKNGGKLTPQQMYETVRRYETYVARNKRLEGKGASSSTSQQRATGHISGYRPQFHKTMAFATTMAVSEDDSHYPQESSPHEGTDSVGAESSQEDDEGLFIPSYLEEALPNDPTLQVKMAHAMWAQEVETRRCFTCNQPGHLPRDHWKYEEKNGTGPLQLKGPPLNKLAQERVKTKPPQPGQTTSQANPPK